MHHLCNMKLLSRIISFVFHPLFLFYYLVLIAFVMDRYAYRMDQARALGAMLIMSFFILVLFPLIAMALFKGLGIVSDWHLSKRRDRIGPLIVTLVFYIWFFVNVKDNVVVADSLRFVALGGAIALGLAFFINNFSKISLHSVGAGAFLVGLGLLAFYTRTSSIVFNLPMIGNYGVSSIFVIILAFVMVGLVGTSRLYLDVHSAEDVYGGYLVGFLSQIIAYFWIIG